MGSSNPVDKITSAAEDIAGSVKKDPLGLATRYLTAGAIGGGLGLMVQGGLDLAARTRQDMRDQAAGMAQKEQDRAAAAERAAINASVKELDPVTLERRRRAALAAVNGRGSTILTSGTSLGSADVARKTLLGM